MVTSLPTLSYDTGRWLFVPLMLAGAMVGLIAGGIMDLALLILEATSGIRRHRYTWTDSLPRSFLARQNTQTPSSRSMAHGVVVIVLVILFAGTVWLALYRSMR